MNLFFIFLTALVVGYSGSLVPGPMFALVVAKSTEQGAWSGLLISAGHAALEAVLLTGLAVGLSQVLSLPPVVAGISMVGGAVMILMGAGMVVQAARGRLYGSTIGADAPRRGTAGPGPPSRNTLRLMGLGALVSISNPYFLLWWVTIGAAYFVSAALAGVPGILAFFVGHVLADLTWFGALGYLAAYGRRFMSPRMYRVFSGICGVALLGVAAYFMLRGVAGV